MCDELSTTITTIGQTLRWGRAQLVPAAPDTPGLDAEVLLRHALGMDRTALFTRLPDAIDVESLAIYQRLVRMRGNGVPVAYLTGVREFMGLPFAVGPQVLIPRPETEILVEWALGWLNGREDVTIVDIGTGSGAIALSVAALLNPDDSARIIGVDISDAALAVAARNRAQLGLDDKVSLVKGFLLAPILGSVDLILANLPYLKPAQIAENLGLAAEPRLALDGGADGLDLIRQLLEAAPRAMNAGGAIGIEIDPSQRQSVVALSHSAFPGAHVTVLSDHAGHDRHVIVQLGLLNQP